MRNDNLSDMNQNSYCNFGWGNPATYCSPGGGNMETEMYNVILQGQKMLAAGQRGLGFQISEMGNQFNQVLDKVRKGHRKVVDYTAVSCEKDGLLLAQRYDDGSTGCMPLIERPVGSPEFTKISYDNDRFKFVVLEWPSSERVVILLSEIKPSTLMDAFINAGVRFNPLIPKPKVRQALHNWFMLMVRCCERQVILSGYAGWEAGHFICAEDMQYLNDYKYKINLPVFDKHFDKNAVNLARIDDYKNYLLRIQKPNNRLLFSLIPFAGILFSWFADWHIYESVVVNLISMTETTKPSDFAEYLQVFNRDHVQTFSASMSSKKLQTVIRNSKDEVLIFTGMQDNIQSNYLNQKVVEKLEGIASNALGKTGIEYGDYELQSLVVLISTSPVRQRNVKHIFIEDDFFKESEKKELQVSSIQSVLANFVLYVEGHKKEVEMLAQEQYDVYSGSERYWRVLIALVNDFWKGIGSSLEEVMNLPADFQYDFLWQEDEYDWENGSDAVVMAVRKAMLDIRVVPKERFTGVEQFLYDSEYVWILPDLFKKIMDDSGMGRQRESLLLRCKEAGMLKTDGYSGYTTRIQGKNVRKGYYKFRRECFNGVGQVEIITLGGM